jgi:hypothetical protein
MNIMGLGICVVVYRIVAYLILKMVKERWLGRLWRKAGGGKKKEAQGTPQTSALSEV